MPGHACLSARNFGRSVLLWIIFLVKVVSKQLLTYYLNIQSFAYFIKLFAACRVQLQVSRYFSNIMHKLWSSSSHRNTFVCQKWAWFPVQTLCIWLEWFQSHYIGTNCTKNYLLMRKLWVQWHLLMGRVGDFNLQNLNPGSKFLILLNLLQKVSLVSSPID